MKYTIIIIHETKLHLSIHQEKHNNKIKIVQTRKQE